ncbi:pseudouridylate synthase 4 [Flagelloscypha sp. PMI_526]|nr:pseudouridylate synthase 4 [Flagelloscypha sp. PMI_526]
MPKAVTSIFPVSGLFGVAKPSGPTSMSVVNEISALISRSKLFAGDKAKPARSQNQKVKKFRGKDAVKIGQGGTLDPLADGVLVIGVGKGTKKLSDFLHCTKEYRTTCLLGCETDSYDSEGARVRTAPWRHVTRELIESKLSAFTGDIKQTPPIFSALKMDGKPLYEYAREGIPLPRPIEARPVTVHSLIIEDWIGSNHTFKWPSKVLDAKAKEALAKTLESIEEQVDLDDKAKDEDTEGTASAFVLSMSVSGGTYVRSVVHDLAHAVDSAGHVVTLSRTRQGRYVVGESREEGDMSCVPWSVFEEALKDPGEPDENGLLAWERTVQEQLEIVE